MKSKQKPQKTRWHRLLGRLFRELLVPTGILVYTDVPVMGDPPEADILLLRKKRSRWTEEQRSRLPDGIRDSRATHILIEFKYTESVNRNALIQTLCYDYLYKLKYIRFSILHLVLSEGYRAFFEHVKCKLLTILNLTDIMTPNSVKSDSCHQIAAVRARSGTPSGISPAFRGQRPESDSK